MNHEARRQLQDARLRLSAEDQQRLQAICERHGIASTLLRDLMVVEDDLSLMERRHGLFDRLSDTLTKHAD